MEVLPRFDVELERSKDLTAVLLTVSGELDMTTAPELEAIGEVIAGWGETTAVQLDLGNVTFLNSCGISALVGCSKRLDQAGIKFTLQGAHGLPRKVLELTGMLP